MSLTFKERPAAGDAEGLLILHHGRGSDEMDLLSLADMLDPQQRLHVVTPRAPLQLPGSPGYHWYHVPRVGFPDHATFLDAYRALTRFHDELWERTGIAPARTVLGGFSMGTVMSYSTGLGPGRPVVGGILAFSGFIPTVDDWTADLAPRHDTTRVLISHGRADPIMGVDFARHANEVLTGADFDVEYQESDIAHSIDPTHLRRATSWLAETFKHSPAGV